MLEKIEILLVIFFLILLFYIVISFGAKRGQKKESKQIKSYLFNVRILLIIHVDTPGCVGFYKRLGCKLIEKYD